jgi:hypothetical protein
LKRLVRLRAGGEVPMSLLAACPHWTGLRELSIESSRIDDRDIDALLANRSLERLRAFKLWDVNEGTPKLSRQAEQRLRGRFGTAFQIHYSIQCLG